MRNGAAAHLLLNAYYPFRWRGGTYHELVVDLMEWRLSQAAREKTVADVYDVAEKKVYLLLQHIVDGSFSLPSSYTELTAVLGRTAAITGCRAVIDMIRHEDRRQAQEPRLIEHIETQLQERQVDPAGDVDCENLYVAMAKLASEDRAILLLRYVDGYGIEEIADMQQVTSRTIHNRLRRALTQLKEDLSL